MAKYENVNQYLEENNIYLFESEIFDEIDEICEGTKMRVAGDIGARAVGVGGGGYAGAKLADKMGLKGQHKAIATGIGAIAGGLTGGALYKKLVMKGKSHSQAAMAAANLEAKKGNHQAAQKLRQKAAQYKQMGR
jgi:outer membrane lipoprotein SlyB